MKKHTQMASFERNFEQNQFSRFATTIDAKQLKKITSPSPVLVGGTEEIGLVKLAPERIEQFLYMHPVIPRGIEIKANRMTGRGFVIKPKNETEGAKRAAKEMRDLIENSGGTLLINKWIQDAFAFGNGYLTLIQSKRSNKILKLNQEHPIYFRIARKILGPKADLTNAEVSNMSFEFNGPLKINEKTKTPEAYVQVRIQDDKRVVPFGMEIPAKKVAHLVFDSWGDEAQGISVIQYVFLNIKHLLNIEEAGAETMYRTGFTQKKITTKVRSEKDLKRMARHLTQINTKDAIILPEGTDVTNLLPGASQFKEFHDVFLTLLGIRLGIPKPILTLDGTDINKSTMDELVKDMMVDFAADELKVKRVIECQIFEPACKMLFGNSFDDIPLFEFKPFLEEGARIASINRESAETISTLTNAMEKAQSLGQDKIAEKIANHLFNIIPEVPENEQVSDVYELISRQSFHTKKESDKKGLKKDRAKATDESQKITGKKPKL